MLTLFSGVEVTRDDDGVVRLVWDDELGEEYFCRVRAVATQPDEEAAVGESVQHTAPVVARARMTPRPVEFQMRGTAADQEDDHLDR